MASCFAVQVFTLKQQIYKNRCTDIGYRQLVINVKACFFLIIFAVLLGDIVNVVHRIA